MLESFRALGWAEYVAREEKRAATLNPWKLREDAFVMTALEEAAAGVDVDHDTEPREEWGGASSRAEWGQGEPSRLEVESKATKWLQKGRLASRKK